MRRTWQDLNTADLATAETGRMIAVLPVAAIEQHGPHLPLDTDRAIVDAVVDAALADVPDAVAAYVLPTQAVGLSVEHAAFPGTLTLEAETLLALWAEIGASVARAGVAKIILVNSHGGNSNLVGLVTQRLRSDHGMTALGHHCYRIWRTADYFPESERLHGIHGGAIETSLMLAIAPDKVRMAAARDFVPASVAWARDHGALAPGGRPSFAWEMQDLNATGAAGNATDADAARGRRLLDMAARELAEVVIALDRFDPPDHGDAAG